MATKSVFETKYSPTKKKKTSVGNAAKPAMTAIKKGVTIAAKTASKVTPKAPANKTSTGILNADVSSALKKLTSTPKAPANKPPIKPTSPKPAAKKTSVVAAAKPIMKNITAGAAAASKVASTVAKNAPTKPKAPQIKMEMYPKKPTIKAVGTGKVPSIAKATAGKAPVKKETFNLDAEVKKTMSGAYGSGEARKKALGTNYAAVQAEINKRSAANKPKTSTAPKAAPAKTETKSEPIVMKTKKVTEIPTSGAKSISPVATKSGGSGLGAKAKTDQEMAKLGFRKGGAVKRKMKTGGMVNPNSNISYQKIAGSKGVTSGVNAKASASKVASSRGSGRANTPPSKAVPVAKRGGMIKRRK